jgi:hypothetical protein
MNHSPERNETNFSSGSYLNLSEGESILMKEFFLSVSSFRINNPKKQRDLMNAIKSIALKLLKAKIETTSLTYGKGIFLVQQNIAEYLQDRMIVNLGAEVP